VSTHAHDVRMHTGTSDSFADLFALTRGSAYARTEFSMHTPHRQGHSHYRKYARTRSHTHTAYANTTATHERQSLVQRSHRSLARHPPSLSFGTRGPLARYSRYSRSVLSLLSLGTRGTLARYSPFTM
jgi:hypothetical protein